MADYDEDAVLEAIARLQPQISALSTKIQNLEASSPADITDLQNRISELEKVVNVPVNPITVIQAYEDGTEVVYKKV